MCRKMATDTPLACRLYTQTCRLYTSSVSVIHLFTGWSFDSAVMRKSGIYAPFTYGWTSCKGLTGAKNGLIGSYIGIIYGIYAPSTYG
jgi:hypothetical protein